MQKKMKELMQTHHLDEKFDALMQSALNDSDVKAFLNQHQEALSADAISKSAAKIYEFVTEKNKLKNGQATFAPGYAPKLILNNHFIDVMYEPTDQLKQKQAQDKLNAQITRFNVPKDIQQADLTEFDPTDRSMAYQKAVELVDALTTQPDNFHKGLYLTGNFGVGKTYLLGAIANELAPMSIKTTIVHFPSFAVEMKNAIAANNVLEQINKIKFAPVLMIDDIGAEEISPWIRDEVLGIILQYRMQEQKVTCFSSNFTMAELQQHLSQSNRGGQEPIKAKRIMERVKYLAQEISVAGVNRRQKN